MLSKPEICLIMKKIDVKCGTKNSIECGDYKMGVV